MLVNTIILLGALQGMITGCFLFFAKQHRIANRLLAAAIWCMAVASLNVYLNYTGWYYSSTTIAVLHALVPMVIIMPVGPLMYYYFRACLEPNFKLPKKSYLHFLPVIVDLVPSLTTIIYLAGVGMGWISSNPRPWGMFIDQYNVYSDLPRWVSLTGYALLSLQYLNIQKKSTQVQQIKWPEQFVYALLVFQLVWLIYLVPYMVPEWTDSMLNKLGWYPVYVPMAVLIYWLGIKGYIFHLQRPHQKNKSNTSGLLTPELIELTVSSLNKSMETDQVYLNPDLNLALLAKHTGLGPKTISAVLNQHMQKSFADFVNGYRVEAFKKKLLLPEMQHLTIAGIAMQCGFSSKASFQRIFKQFTGASPSDFQKSLLQGG